MPVSFFCPTPSARQTAPNQPPPRFRVPILQNFLLQLHSLPGPQTLDQGVTPHGKLWESYRVVGVSTSKNITTATLLGASSQPKRKKYEEITSNVQEHSNSRIIIRHLYIMYAFNFLYHIYQTRFNHPINNPMIWSPFFPHDLPILASATEASRITNVFDMKQTNAFPVVMVKSCCYLRFQQ